MDARLCPMGGGPGTGKLLERDGELEAIRRVVEQARDGLGSAVVIEAAAGIGKTALLRAAQALGREAGLVTVSGRASELEKEFPFGLVRQLLEPVVASAPSDSDLFAGAAGLARPLVDPGAALGDEGGDPTFSALHGLYWLLHNLAKESPLLITVDDLQWADASSLRFLSFLLTRLEGLPLGCVAASRPSDREGGDPLLARVMSSPSARDLLPQPLTEDGTARFVERELGEPPDPVFVSACHRASAGNPFYLRELIRELAQGQAGTGADDAELVGKLGPPSVSRSVLLRLSSLPHGAADLVKAIAVLGDGAELGEVAALAEIPEDEAANALDALTRAHVLDASAALGFHHPIVREAVYADFDPQHRARSHARAALMLAESGVPVERVAAQLLAATRGAVPQAADLLLAAANDALGRGSPEVAVRYLERALDEPVGPEMRAELLALHGEAAARVRDPRAVDSFQQALELSADDASRGDIVISLARALLMAGRLDDAIVTLEEAIEALEDRDREQRLRLESELLGAARLDISRRQDAGRRLERVAEGVAGDTPAERLVLANVAFEQVVRGQGSAAAAELAQRALADGALLAEQTPDSPVYYLAAWTLALADLLEPADLALESALRDARVRGSALGFTIASCFRSNVAYRMGAVPEAEVNARAVLDVDPEERWPLGLPFAVGFLLDALVEQGKLDAAAQVLEETGFAEGDLPDFTLFIVTLCGRGRVRLARGDEERGLADLLLAGERSVRWGSRNPTFLPWRSEAALALHASGEGDRAGELVEEELTLARTAGAERAVGIALRTNALLEPEQAEPLLQESATRLDRCGARLDRAKSLVELGALLRRRNRRSESRGPLREGLDLARQCGAQVVAERAEAELASTGARPRRETRSGLEALTPSERRVADLAREGATNAQIAQALFVSLKTVETHLSSVYRKLGLRSRHELRDVLVPS